MLQLNQDLNVKNNRGQITFFPLNIIVRFHHKDTKGTKITVLFLIFLRVFVAGTNRFLISVNPPSGNTAIYPGFTPGKIWDLWN